MSETFDFGSGPVPAHKHPNGGGWVADTASVDATAYVGPNARVYGNARVCGDAQVCDNAWVSDNARVCGDARVCGNARVYGNARVSDNARVCGDAWVSTGSFDIPVLCINHLLPWPITQSKPGFVHVGCQLLSLDDLTALRGMASRRSVADETFDKTVQVITALGWL